MDKVADLLIRIKNGYMARRVEVVVTYSKLNEAILAVLKEENFIDSVKIEAKTRLINVTLKYEQKNPAMTDVKRVSTPGRRVYMGVKTLPRVLNGLGMAIVSTPKGIMTDEKARKEGVGGEVMAYVW